MSVSAKRLVNMLSTVRLNNVFNPYVDQCARYDLPGAARKRRQNLERSLSTAINLEVQTIWIARDLGYLSGRRTGLALTDEVHLRAHNDLFGGPPVEKATKDPPRKERTAGVIWQMLVRIKQPVFLWNVFPLHPHKPNNPMGNRCHRANERNACAQFLPMIVDLLQPMRIIAIGNHAHRAVKNLGIDIIQVRHPSYGGKNKFIHKIKEVYNL